jgi:hypothetical protein
MRSIGDLQSTSSEPCSSTMEPRPFTPLQSNPGKTMPEISNHPKLIFAFTYNFIANRAGSYNRTRQILSILRDNGIRVTVYSKDSVGDRFWDNAAKRWRKQDREEFEREYPNFELVLDRVTFGSWIVRKLKNLVSTVVPMRAANILRIGIPFLDPNWESLKRRGTEILVVGYTNTLPELNGLFGRFCVVDQHDIEFVLNQRTRYSFFFEVPVLLKARREVAMLETLSMIISISYSESIVNRMLLQNPTVVYLPNLSEFDSRHYALAAPKYDLLFVGGDSHFNRVGLSTFLREVVNRRAKYKIGIVGLVCNGVEIIEIAGHSDHIELLGFVTDLDGLYATSRATVCPIEGAGTKTKLLESLQHQRPVFASQRSLEGLLPGYEKCVFPLDLERIEEVLQANPNVHLECGRYIKKYETAIRDNEFIELVKRVAV